MVTTVHIDAYIQRKYHSNAFTLCDKGDFTYCAIVISYLFCFIPFPRLPLFCRGRY